MVNVAKSSEIVTSRIGEGLRNLKFPKPFLPETRLFPMSEARRIHIIDEGGHNLLSCAENANQPAALLASIVGGVALQCQATLRIFTDEFPIAGTYLLKRVVEGIFVVFLKVRP